MGGPDRGGSGCSSSSAQAGTQSLDEWESVRCSGADEERFLCARHLEPSERTRLRVSARCDSASRFSTEESGGALCWIGFRRSPLCTPTHEPPRILLLTFQGYFQRENIGEISHCVRSRERRGGSRGTPQPTPPLSLHLSPSLSSPQRGCRSFRWRDTWFPLSKRRSSFVNGFGFFYFFFFVGTGGRLLLTPHGCPRFKRSGFRRLSSGLYYLKSRM